MAVKELENNLGGWVMIAFWGGGGPRRGSRSTGRCTFVLDAPPAEERRGASRFCAASWWRARGTPAP